MNRFQKKGIVFSVCFAFVLFLGWNLYLIRYKEALLVLKYTQNILIQVAGEKGKFSYSKALVLKVSQTVFVEGIDLSLQDGSHLKIKNLRLIPSSGRKIAKIIAKNVIWSKGDNSIFLKRLSLYEVLLSKKVKQADNPIKGLLETSFQKAIFGTGKFHFAMGNINIVNGQVKHIYKQDPSLIIQLNIIDYIDSSTTIIKNLVNHVYINHFMILIKDKYGQIKLNSLPILFKQKKIFYTFSKVSGYSFSYPIWSVSEAKFESFPAENKVINGNCILNNFSYNLSKENNNFAKYLQKLEYSSLKGHLHCNYAYDLNRSILNLNSIKYEGKDFVDIKFVGQVYFDVATRDEHNIFLRKIFIKSGNIVVSDKGFKKHFLKERSDKLQISQSEAQNNILHNLDSSEQGKDFNLDYQFYKSLAQSVKDPNRKIKVAFDFPQKVSLEHFVNSNFLELFKLANQGNMQITAIKNQ